jgi:hypothetical protein
MSAPAPLRFLALVAIGWIGVRALVLAPGWWVERGEARPDVAVEAAGTPAGTPQPAPLRTEELTASRITVAPLQATTRIHPLIRELPYKGASAPPGPVVPLPAFARVERGPTVPSLSAAAASPAAASPAAAPPAVGAGPLPTAGSLDPSLPGARRWSASAWALVRSDEGGAGLAPGGTLGGSQAGGRLLYRVGDGLALSARAYLPLRRTRGAEAAAGVDWQPAAHAPIHLLAERRQDLGGEGRSAFALSAYGGTSARLPRGLRLDAYAQAGVVGARSRDLFADGAVRVSAPLGPVEAGAGAWGGAQPGVARLDAGPQVSWRLPVEGANLRIEADWRFRIAGDAAPGSGPALTLAADF